MSIVLDQISSIKDRIETTETKIKNLSAENQDKIEANNQKIKDLGKQIDDIFAEIKKCQDEFAQVNSNYEQTRLNLEEARLESSEYDLIDDNVLNKLIQAAEEKKNQLLSEIETTLTSLNENLNGIRAKIQELDIENGALSDLSSLVEEKYSQLVEAFNDILSNIKIQLEPLEEALANNSSSSNNPSFSQTKAEEKPRVSKTIDLEDFFKTKEKSEEILSEPVIDDKTSEDTSVNKPEEEKVEEEPTADLTSQIQEKPFFNRILSDDKTKEEANESTPEEIEIEESTADLSSLIQEKPFFNGIVDNASIIPEDNLVSLEDMINTESTIPESQEKSESEVNLNPNQELEPNESITALNQPIIDESKEKQPKPDLVFEETFSETEKQPEAEKESESENNHENKTVEMLPNQQKFTENVSLNEQETQQPTLQEQLNSEAILQKQKYIGLDRLGLSSEQEDYVMKNIVPEKFSQLINIIHNYGIGIDNENLGPYYQYIAHVEEPKMIDEIFTLLRGIGKNNNGLDFSTMLDHILVSHPETVQNNIIQLYSLGKDPLTMQTQLLCSDYFDNIQMLKDEGFDTDALIKAFPEKICSMPLIQFKKSLEGLSKFSNVEPEQKTYGGRAA